MIDILRENSYDNQRNSCEFDTKIVEKIHTIWEFVEIIFFVHLNRSEDK